MSTGAIKRHYEKGDRGMLLPLSCSPTSPVANPVHHRSACPQPRFPCSVVGALVDSSGVNTGGSMIISVRTFMSLIGMLVVGR